MLPYRLPDIEDPIWDWDSRFATQREFLEEKKAVGLYVDQDGRPNERFKKEVIGGVKDANDRFVAKAKGYGVCCFSASCSDILMWSHYADGHRGLCLEFDSRCFPPDKVFQVNYSECYPSLPPEVATLDRPLQFDKLMELLTTKSKHWEYEEEWRVFTEVGGKPINYSPDVLTRVYFGCAMTEVHIDVLTQLLRGTPTRLYKMQPSKTGFEVTAEPYRTCDEVAIHRQGESRVSAPAGGCG
jgi:hypothetical protein